ncbi:hypothetical protein C8Q74DRAFT_780388 [Fomes fomentarius]|nr:hypothetical protein C8Q74DRAFT_780388 [Fomes fomentarius]
MRPVTYPSFTLVMTKSGFLARDPSRLPFYRSYTHRYHPYTMAARHPRGQDLLMKMSGGAGGLEPIIEEPEAIRLQSTAAHCGITDGDFLDFEVDPLPLVDDEHVRQYEQAQQARAHSDASPADRVVMAFILYFQGSFIPFPCIYL